MGYFGVLRADQNQKCKVVRCHLNLWSLPTFLPSRRLLYLDVGLQIRSTGTVPVKQVEILLPFRVEHGRWPDGDQVAQDLYDYMSTDDVAELVFGGPVSQSQTNEPDQRLLKIGDYADDLLLVRIDADSVAPVSGYSQRADSSLYTVPFQKEIPPGESRYIRLRWRLLESEQLWQRSRRSSGARVDFRICDVRESRFVQRERTMRERLCEIDNVNFFLMAPTHLQPTSNSPSFRYLRVLEQSAWRGYLASTSYSRINGGVLVYYWRYAATSTPLPPMAPTAIPITADNPFRIFIELHKSHSHRWSIPKIILGTVIGLAAFHLAESLNLTRSLLPQVTTGQLVTILGLVGISAIFSGIKRVRGWTRNGFLIPRRVFRSIERFFLNLTSIR